MSRSPSPGSPITPFLIRTFVKQGPGFHAIEDFEDGLEPLRDEYAVWAWPDSTIQHVISLLVASAFPPVFKNASCRYSIRMLFYDQQGSGRSSRGAWRTKEVGLVHGKELGLRQDHLQSNSRTLDGLRFNPGDYLLISVLVPNAMGPGPGGPSTGVGGGGPPASLAIRGSAVASAGPSRYSAGAGGRDMGGPGRLVGGVGVSGGAPQGDESWIDARAAAAASASRQQNGRGGGARGGHGMRRSRSRSPMRRERDGGVRRRSSPTFRDRDRDRDRGMD